MTCNVEGNAPMRFGIHHSAALDKHFILTGSINVAFCDEKNISISNKHNKSRRKNTLYDKLYLPSEKHQIKDLV